MKADRQMWQSWSDSLHRWGVDSLVASLLESLGSLSLLGAQAVYICQPLVGPSISNQHLKALADMLEDGSETQAFIHFLREKALP